MSATEELRRLLDERGIEWWSDSYDLGYDHTEWKTDDASYTSLGLTEDGLLAIEVISTMTPEQAIAATVGRTCELPETPDWCTIERYGIAERYGVTEWRTCSACGSKVLASPARYCPRCGAEAVE